MIDAFNSLPKKVNKLPEKLKYFRLTCAVYTS